MNDLKVAALCRMSLETYNITVAACRRDVDENPESGLSWADIAEDVARGRAALALLHEGGLSPASRRAYAERVSFALDEACAHATVACHGR